MYIFIVHRESWLQFTHDVANFFSENDCLGICAVLHCLLECLVLLNVMQEGTCTCIYLMDLAGLEGVSEESDIVSEGRESGL